MRKTLTLLVALISFAGLRTTNAQNMDNRWLIGAHMHWADYTSTDPIGSGFFDFSDYRGMIAFSRFNVARSLNNSFAVDLAYGVSGFSKNALTGIDNNFFGDLDLSLKYTFANGYLLKKEAHIEPYLIAGPGLSWYGKSNGFAINAGLGFNFWFSDNFGLNLQTELNKVSEDKVGDYFHHSIGLVVRLGGKDSDGDGISDKNDLCPTVAGLEIFNGCPDRDGDGIADKDDACPDVPGLKDMKGCPDADGDGITDKDDACPNDKGTIATNGCPDADGDGIADKDDACPNDKGLAATNGCPDRDGDGIADKDDACPDVKGLAALKGCPDRDGDGVADKDDQCPDVKGLANNHGCPAIDESKKKEVIEKINFAAKNIQFETGKDVIKPVSFAKLDTVVNIMKAYSYTNWSIEGHTDNVGKADKNLDLSKRRAAAVKKYFMDKGIDAARLTSEGYGDTRPAADNKTAAGRAINRRVEIKLID